MTAKAPNDHLPDLSAISKVGDNYRPHADVPCKQSTANKRGVFNKLMGRIDRRSVAARDHLSS